MKHILTAILIFTTVLLFGQSFEGTIVYKIDYEFQISEKLADMGITEEMMFEKMKKEGSFSDSVKTRYKDGNYISYTNFSPQSWSIYKQITNKLYTFQDGEASDICTVTDVSFDLEYKLTRIKPKIEKLDTVVEVNGMKCEIVRVVWKSGTYDYYYNSSFLKLDAKLFENHIYDGWAGFLKISNSLPVKIVKSINGIGKVKYTLIRNFAETIDKSIFEIPKLVADKDLNLIKIKNREVMRIEK